MDGFAFLNFSNQFVSSSLLLTLWNSLCIMLPLIIENHLIKLYSHNRMLHPFKSVCYSPLIRRLVMIVTVMNKKLKKVC